MKKYISLIMALAMVFSLAIPAAAADVTGDTSKNVTASYTPTPVTYTVTVNTAENGTVTANPAEAAEGATVTLTVSPAEGYKLDTLAVKDASDGDVELKEDYTFVMPASNVTVTATFVEQVAPTYDVNVDADIENGTVIANKQTAEKDEEVILTITPNEGYLLYGYEITASNGEAVTVNSDGSFTMPAANVTVKAIFRRPTTELTKIYLDNTLGWDEILVFFYSSDGVLLDDAGAALTIEEAGIYATSDDCSIPQWTSRLVFSNGDASSAIVEIPTNGDDMFVFGAETDGEGRFIGTWERYSPSQDQGVTSADISWGSMAYTYSDETDAWTPDAGKNAGTVTVTNTGETTFTAAVSYIPVADYDEIEGSFDTASAELVREASKTFTLTLRNQPEKVITAGTKIGTVTITIEAVAEATSATITGIEVSPGLAAIDFVLTGTGFDKLSEGKCILKIWIEDDVDDEFERRFNLADPDAFKKLVVEGNTVTGTISAGVREYHISYTSDGGLTWADYEGTVYPEIPGA